MNKHLLYIVLPIISYAFVYNYKISHKLINNHKFTHSDPDSGIISIYNEKEKGFDIYNFSNQTIHFIEYFINNNSAAPGYFYF